MDREKDVLDGWCMYMEKSVGSGSNSSDSESIEIISEDEAGNYQIYSKNYFKPDRVTAGLIQNDTNKKDHLNVGDIKEYFENDPSQFFVEEGKEAQEKEEEVKVPKINKNKKNSSKFELLQPINKCDDEKSVLKDYHRTGKQETELLDLSQTSHKPQEKKQEKVIIQNQKEDEICNDNVSLKEKSVKSIPTESSQIQTKLSVAVESSLKKKIEISTNSAKSDTANEIVEVNKNCIMICNEINAEHVTELKKVESAGSVNSKVEEITVKSDCNQKVPNIPTEKIFENPPNHAPTKCKGTTEKKSVSSNSETVSEDFSKIHQQQTNITLLSTPYSSTGNNQTSTPKLPNESTDSSKTCSVKKARMENQISDTVESSPKSQNVPFLDTPTITPTDETRPSCEPISVKKARKRHISGRKVINKLVKDVCSTSSVRHSKPPEDLQLTTSSNYLPSNSIIVQPDSSSTEKDISSLFLISIVGSVIYLIYSALILPSSNSLVPQNDVKIVDDSLATVHDRYFQLVADWEDKVLENAELDYQIALKERTEKLFRNDRLNISHHISRPLSLPDCMACNILTHTFEYLRQYPPDISDLPSWSKTKFCVDLRLLLIHMRATSFSAVLKLLKFLASPSSELNYQAVFDHYLSQQKMYIHNVIQRDYPEIYRSNAFNRPDEKLRPHMYCVSMQRFSVLKNKYAPQEDNMGALIKLSQLYVHNEACLQAIVRIDGISVDRLYNFVLDVLLSRSISTAITLDPSLLHDYYLELILSNEVNLKKLSRQLFKYNVLAIQKFNLTLKNERILGNKRESNIYKHGVQQEKKITDGFNNKLNKKFDEDWKDQQKQTEIKFVSLNKEEVELFYDSQLREISNGYSSKVRKFLTDINKELKHALCYPYAKDAEGSAPASEKDESLVRFIRNMCRTNVFKDATERQSKDTDKVLVVTPVDFSLDEQQIKSKFENNSYIFSISENLSSQENDKSLQDVQIHTDILKSEQPKTENTDNRGDILTEDVPIVMSNPTATMENYSVIVENEIQSFRNEPDIIYHKNDFVDIENVEFEIENENELYYPTHYDAYDKEREPKVLLNPDNHIYRRSDTQDQVLLNPEDQSGYTFPIKDNNDSGLLNHDNDTENIATREDYRTQNNIPDEQHSDNVKVEESPKNEQNYNMPDLWILNKMADSFGLNDIEEDHLIDAYNIENLEKIGYEDFNHKKRKDRERKQRFDDFEQDLLRNRYNKHGGENNQRNRKDRVNVYDTIRPQARHSSGEKENVRLNKRRDSYNDRVNVYDTKPTFDRRSNIYNSRSGKHSHSKEERVVHIDGHDNKYTRHVYIDNAERRSEESEMDWWLNRRARLRAKLRKKHAYPVQENPEHQYDYLYE